MNRFISLLVSTLLPVATLYAQPNVALNGSDRSTPSASTAVNPRATKAAESPFYVKLSGFYGLLTPGVQTTFSETINQQGTSNPFKTTTKGLGGGVRAGVGIGLILNDFVNVGIDADMLFGAPVKVDAVYDDGTFRSTTTSTTTLKVVSVIPNITFKALSRPSFYIYNRLGLVGGMVLEYKTVKSTLNRPTVGVSTSSQTTDDYTKNSLAIGYQAALGIQFRLSQAIRAFAEVVAYNQSFKPQRLEASTAANTTVLITEYTDQGVQTNPSNPTTGKPQVGQQESFTVPMNSIGVGAGLTFRF